MNVLGLDIGGANIKVADADGRTRCVPFQMWERKHELSQMIGSVSADFAEPDLVALTTTAELADCFLTKREGVRFVIAAVQSAFPEIPIRCWLTSGEFADPDDAADLTELVAAANWHALASWFGRSVPTGPAVMIDMGSTTTDIIPLLDGRPVPHGRTDLHRLQSGELVYTGASRTPLCSVLRAVTSGGVPCGVASELFADMADAFVVLGLRGEDPNDQNTADGRPRTREYCLNRLAHMLCSDSSELSEEQMVEIARVAVTQQQERIHSSLRRVLQRLEQLVTTDSDSAHSAAPTLLISGSGTSIILNYLSHDGNVGGECAADSLLPAMFKTRNTGARAHSGGVEIDWPGDLLILEHVADSGISEAACAYATASLAHDLCRHDLLDVSD